MCLSSLGRNSEFPQLEKNSFFLSFFLSFFQLVNPPAGFPRIHFCSGNAGRQAEPSGWSTTSMSESFLSDLLIKLQHRPVSSHRPTTTTNNVCLTCLPTGILCSWQDVRSRLVPHARAEHVWPRWSGLVTSQACRRGGDGRPSSLLARVDFDNSIRLDTGSNTWWPQTATSRRPHRRPQIRKPDKSETSTAAPAISACLPCRRPRRCFPLLPRS